MPPKVDQYVGAILGCAIGDAIGCVIESQPRATAVDYVSKIVMPKHWAEVPNLTYVRDHDWIFGQYTDDTQLTRELSLSIVENGGFDPESFAGRIATLFHTGQVVGAGGATRTAADLLYRGTHWEEAGTPPPRAGNGGAMRAAPIGLLHWDDSEALCRDAWDQARITHQAEMSCAGSVAIAMGVGMTLCAGSATSHPGEPGWWDWLALWVERAGSSEFAADIRNLTVQHFKTQEKSSAVLKWVLEEDKKTHVNGSGHHSWDGISPWARTSTLWALYAFMRSPKDFWKTLHTALLAGGDTDTMAAMACTLSGAYNGTAQFLDDTYLLGSLQDKSKWNAVELTGLATQLWKISTSCDSATSTEVDSASLIEPT